MKRNARKVRAMTYLAFVNLWGRIVLLLLAVALARNWFHAGPALLSGRQNAVWEYLFDWWTPLFFLAVGSLFFVVSDRGNDLYDGFGFRKVLGFWPPRRGSDHRLILMRKRAETIIASLATEYMEADYRERKLNLIIQRIRHVDEWDMSFLEGKREELAGVVAKAKARFWQAATLASAHNLADFTSRYEDYVPREDHERIKEEYQTFGEALLSHPEPKLMLERI